MASCGQEEPWERRIATLGQVALEGSDLIRPQGLLRRQAAFEAGAPEAAVGQIEIRALEPAAFRDAPSMVEGSHAQGGIPSAGARGCPRGPRAEHF